MQDARYSWFRKTKTQAAALDKAAHETTIGRLCELGPKVWLLCYVHTFALVGSCVPLAASPLEYSPLEYSAVSSRSKVTLYCSIPIAHVSVNPYHRKQQDGKHIPLKERAQGADSAAPGPLQLSSSFSSSVVAKQSRR